MVRPITVGLDGSPESLAAAGWAAREAELRGLRLHLLHAWVHPPRTARAAEEPETRREWMLGILNETKADLTARHPELEISTEQVSETVVPALLARTVTSEMLVLGSRGQGVVAGFLLGSAGLQVLGHAKGPVVMVRRTAEDEPERAGDEVVVGVQELDESASAPLQFAFAAASAHRVPLRAVRAWNLPPMYAYSPESLRLFELDGGIEAHERRVLAEAVRQWREKYPDVPVTEHVELGSAAEVLLSAASRARLLVVGRQIHRPPLAPRLGHVVHAALHHASCPVAVVPHE